LVWKLKERQRYALIEQDTENPLKHKGTFYIGPRHVKHRVTKEFVEFDYAENPAFASEKNCRVFAQNSHAAIEVYDYYAKLFNPDYETVSVYDERFAVQYLFKTTPKEDWRDVGAWNPSIKVVPLDDGVEIKKIFDTDYGTASLEVSYIVRTGAFLKHKIVFSNKTADTKTFRVVMKLAGIANSKVNHKDGMETITTEKHVISPFFFIGENQQTLKLSEYLWSLGILDNITGEWNPTVLKDIVFDVHAQGCKADIIIGNYTLAQNESLTIDPTTSTWQVGASSDDCYVRRSDSYFSLTGGYCPCGDYNATYYDYEAGVRFTGVNIPQGATIDSAYFKLRAASFSGSIPTTRVIGQDADNAATFSTYADYTGRSRTASEVSWTPSEWVGGTWYTSPDIKTVVQAIVNRAGWVSGNALVIFWQHALGWGGVDQNLSAYSYDYNAAYAPKLEITWTEAVAWTKSVVQSVSVASLPFKEPSKLTVQTASVASILTRVFAARREYTQSLSVGTVLFKEAEKTRIETVSVATVLAKILELIRVFSQSVSVTVLPFKDSEVVRQQLISVVSTKIIEAQYRREYAQLISVYTTPTWAREIIRLLTEYVSVTDLLLPRQVETLRTQPISITSLSLKDVTIPEIQPVSVIPFPLKEASKPLSQLISVLPIALKDSSKFILQPITVLQILQRIAEYQRVQTQPVSTLALLEKQPYKPLIQVITPTTYISKASEIPRIQMIEVPTSLVKASQKPLSQVVSVASTPAWLLQLIRLLTQPVTVDVSTVKQVAKVKPEMVSVLTTPTIIAQFLRTLTQPATILPTVVKAPTKVKTETISVVDTKTFVSQFQRVKTQPITVLSTPTTILELIRTLTQPITVVTTPSWYRELLKALAQSVSVDTVLAKAIQKYTTEIVKPCVVIEMVYVPELGRYIIIIDNELGILS
jgi:hypothetical protein